MHVGIILKFLHVTSVFINHLLIAVLLYFIAVVLFCVDICYFGFTIVFQVIYTLLLVSACKSLEAHLTG